MDRDRFEKGLNMRRDVLGAEYVDQVMGQADGFTRPFQEMMTEWCWGFGWGDETLPPKTRSLLNLTMLAALNRMHEWELHLRGARNNGVTVDEIRAVIHQIAIYCGVPAGVECFRIAKRVLDENPEG
ncbi:MAG: carboxymuconolactone decarboxylase family protein [Rhodospirillales bacterium]|nr:carboxymuconolactone decarboxylase family protein [Rhodospirillales bacterium]MCW9002144.1 carboxymuconolactone decarboxylase family protein [Rhodospirillales bacterium]MCW9039769.1 carboxymuconolactone decarboxylase family protein [Rhodospirillales bacterium]